MHLATYPFILKTFMFFISYFFKINRLVPVALLLLRKCRFMWFLFFLIGFIFCLQYLWYSFILSTCPPVVFMPFLCYLLASLVVQSKQLVVCVCLLVCLDINLSDKSDYLWPTCSACWFSLTPSEVKFSGQGHGVYGHRMYQ